MLHIKGKVKNVSLSDNYCHADHWVGQLRLPNVSISWKCSDPTLPSVPLLSHLIDFSLFLIGKGVMRSSGNVGRNYVCLFRIKFCLTTVIHTCTFILSCQSQRPLYSWFSPFGERSTSSGNKEDWIKENNLKQAVKHGCGFKEIHD